MTETISILNLSGRETVANHEHRFLQLNDAGGQKLEGKEWIYCFECAKSANFSTVLNDFHTFLISVLSKLNVVTSQNINYLICVVYYFP